MATIIFACLSVIAFVGAGTVVFASDTTRMGLGLGVFLLATAGFFALFGSPFLAIAWVFVYVGGVLVLMLFAIMLVHRTPEGRPGLESRHDIASIAVAVSAFVIVFASLNGTLGSGIPQFTGASVDSLSELLLGPMLPVFEAAGVLLLAALLAVLAVVGGERE